MSKYRIFAKSKRPIPNPTVNGYFYLDFGGRGNVKVTPLLYLRPMIGGTGFHITSIFFDIDKVRISVLITDYPLQFPLLHP